MMTMTFEAQFEKDKDKILTDYFTFLKFPTVATDPAHHKDVLACADWLTNYLKEIGLEVEQWETANAPVLFAHDLKAGPEKPTLLLYCHYDVQPVDPLNEWITPPFEPTIRDDAVYARGASDNKGQCFYTITALKYLLKELKQLPVNLKFVIEGEEESGSSGLSKILQDKKEALKADYLLIVDSGMDSLEEPAITLGARGIICLEMTLQESKIDLHSGMAGGLAYNPNRALAELLAKLHDADGKVAIDGFYDEVTEISDLEKKEISFNFDPEHFHKMFGFYPNGMEKGFSPTEAGWIRPTLEINGMRGGYTGPGFKTVIPAKASAKISCRLVPNQDPKKIAALVTDFLIKNTPKGMDLHVENLAGSGRGFRTDPQSKLANLLCQSYSDVFKKPCKKILIGGSVPISAELCEASEASLLLIGVALPGDHIHAPNEHFQLEGFKKGFLTICRTIELFK